MVYITGDTHAQFNRFNTKMFPEQKEMSKDDYVIICGDFGGVWNYFYSTKEEKYWLDWLGNKPFTLLFVDGNHENFDRLCGDFPTINYHGGKAHKIRNNIYHLMRGYVFEFDNKKFFVFGGAKSHDIQDGILRLENYPTLSDLVKDYNRLTKSGKMLRINQLSWWDKELPAYHEMKRGIRELEKVDYNVDYVITHCLPYSIISTLYTNSRDKLTKYFDSLLDKGLDFTEWHCGHYHMETKLLDKYIIHYEEIKRLI